jgi:succinate dehydrogenase hydrophobic anchor subunit
MKLLLAQRLSALAFLVGFVAHAHFVDARSERLWQVALLGLIVVSGVVHLVTGLYVVVTDYDARPRTVRVLVPVLALASGAALVAAGSGVATSDASAPTPGHLAGSSCRSCHAGTEARHLRARLPEHLEAGVGCEGCHDVVQGERPLLTRRWPSGGSPCAPCHDDAGGLASRSADTTSQPSHSGPPAPSASAAASSAPRLCADQARGEVALDAALGRASVRYELRSTDRKRFQDGATSIELRAAMLGDELVLDATWVDHTADGVDSLSVMLLGDRDLAAFRRLGCTASCHLGAENPHALDADDWAWLVTADERGARARRVTGKGLLPSTPAPWSSFRREADRPRVRLHLPRSRARAPNGAVTIGVAVFDGTLEAHAVAIKPIEVWLDCAATTAP